MSNNRVRVLVIAMLIFALTGLTYKRNSLWSDRLAFWLDAAAKSPDKARPHCISGGELMKRGLLNDALLEYERAIEIKRYYPPALAALGDIRREEGRMDEARRYYYRALGKYPKIPYLWFLIGLSYDEEDRLVEAGRYYARALDYRPYDLRTLMKLGHVMRRTGRLEEMRALLRRAELMDPSIFDHQPMLRELLDEGQEAK